MSCAQSPTLGLSSALIQVLAIMSWRTSTATAAANPKPARILLRPELASSSSSSSIFRVVTCAVGNDVPNGWVGAWSWTVAFGRVGAPPPGRSALVAEDVARRIVGAGAPVGAPTGRSGIVGAGDVGTGGAPGTGGRTGGAIGMVAEGTAGGASAAFKVTRTVSFLRGTLDVCLVRGTLDVCLVRGTLDVCLDGTGGWFSFSGMRVRDVEWLTRGVRQVPQPLSNLQHRNSLLFFDDLWCAP